MGQLKCLGSLNAKAEDGFHSVYASFLGESLRVRQVEFLSIYMVQYIKILNLLFTKLMEDMSND